MKGVTDGTTAMNGISKGEAMLRDAVQLNEMTTSTFGIKNITSTQYRNVPVVTPKD